MTHISEQENSSWVIREGLSLTIFSGSEQTFPFFFFLKKQKQKKQNTKAEGGKWK